MPRPVPARWRGARGDGDAFEDIDLGDREPALRARARMVTQVRGGKPEAAHRCAEGDQELPQDDVDRLSSYAAFAYLVDTQDQAALEAGRGNGTARRRCRKRSRAGRRDWRRTGWRSSSAPPAISKRLRNRRRRCRAHVIGRRVLGGAKLDARRKTGARSFRSTSRRPPSAGTFYGMLASRAARPRHGHGIHRAAARRRGVRPIDAEQRGAARRRALADRPQGHDGRRSRARVRRDRSLAR